MAVTASRTGQLLNLASLARDVGINQPTAERWLSILAASNIVYLLRPYSNNLTKRAVKTPKLYFLDTGLRSISDALEHAGSIEKRRDGGRVL